MLDDVRGVAFSHDNKWVASGSGDKSVRLWCSEDSSKNQILQGHSGMYVCIYVCISTSISCSQDFTQSSSSTTTTNGLSLGSREMRHMLSPSLQAVLRQYRKERVGTGRGGQRISLVQKWTMLKQGIAFPAEDLPFVLLEFQRAATHAHEYWRSYDSSVRKYILNHAEHHVVMRVSVGWQTSTWTRIWTLTTRM